MVPHSVHQVIQLTYNPWENYENKELRNRYLFTGTKVLTNPLTKYLKDAQKTHFNLFGKPTDFSLSLAFKSIIESRIMWYSQNVPS